MSEQTDVEVVEVAATILTTEVEDRSREWWADNAKELAMGLLTLARSGGERAPEDAFSELRSEQGTG